MGRQVFIEKHVFPLLGVFSEIALDVDRGHFVSHTYNAMRVEQESCMQEGCATLQAIRANTLQAVAMAAGLKEVPARRIEWVR